MLDSPAASDLLQSPGDGRTIPSGRFVDNVLLGLHARTHRTTDESNNKDSEDALEGDAAEDADAIDPGADDFWDGEDVNIEDEVGPREDIVSIAYSCDSLAFLHSGEFSISDHDLNILRPFAMKIRNNITNLAFNDMSYIFSKAGMENIAKTRSLVRSLSRFEPIRFACCINSCICYAGPYAKLDKCPKCGTSRLNKSG